MDDYFFIAIVLSVLLSFVVASQGEYRKIGFWGALFISLIFTPLIGILVVLASERKQSKSKTKISGEAKKLFDASLEHYKKEKFETAIEKLKKANGLQPNNPTILIGLAYNFLKKRNFPEAIDYIERAISAGYSNYKRIQTHEDFEELRNTELFDEFVKNGYKQNQ